MKKLLALAFALMLIFSVALADEPLTIAVSMRSTASEYHMQYVAGAELFAASLPEGTAVVQALPCEGNDDKQINDVNALIAAKGDNMILFIDANNAPNIVPIAEACEEAGVYWSAAWNAPEGVLPTDYDHWVTFQSCDAVEQGYLIAKTLFESFPTPGQGKICVLEGLLANNANTDRMKGLKKALWCACDDMAIGVVQALKAKGLNGKIKTTGVDGTSAAIALVESGDLACTIMNNGWLQAGYGAAYAYAAKTGVIKTSEMDNTHRMFLTSGFLVTPDTMDEYRKTFVENAPAYDYNDLDYVIAGPMF